MWYNREYESTSLHPTVNRRRTQPGPGGIAIVGCLCLATLPNFAGLRPRRTSPRDRQAGRLPQTDGPHRHPRLQCPWTGGPARRLLAPPSTAYHLLRGRPLALTGSAASQSARLWQSTWYLDLRVGSLVSFEQGITQTLLSDESVRRALKRLKTNWKRAKHWITSPDPQYLLKKKLVTA